MEQPETIEEARIPDGYNPDGFFYRDITINIKNGLHMRPAQQLQEIAQRDDNTKVQVYYPLGDEYLSVGVLHLTMLGAKRGTTVEFRAKGEYAEEVLSEIEKTIIQYKENAA